MRHDPTLMHSCREVSQEAQWQTPALPAAAAPEPALAELPHRHCHASTAACSGSVRAHELTEVDLEKDVTLGGHLELKDRCKPSVAVIDSVCA